MCYKTTSQIKWDDWHCKSFSSIDIVLIAVLIIHANNKHSACGFYVNKHAF